MLITNEWLPVVGPTMTPIVQLLQTFARLEETISISGPTGAGKSRLAQWCHHESGRTGPFEVVDLQSIPETTQMGELFGWRKGAFTGASDDHQGFVGRAAGGTLFLDEVDKMSLRAQAGLLQLLETRTYRSLGDTTSRQADVRFIVGTNADLLENVRLGKFRQDLYYRIHVLPATLPSLNERSDEIEDWAVYMLGRRAADAHFAPDARAALRQASWPGNLRQLDNVVRRAYAFACAERGHDDPPVEIGAGHVSQALAVETPTASTSKAGIPLTDAAHLVAAAALDRFANQETTDPRTIQGFWGLVIAAALEQGATMNTVLEMFGRERLLEARNHRRTLRREAQRGAELLRCIRATPRGRLTELIA